MPQPRRILRLGVLAAASLLLAWRAEAQSGTVTDPEGRRTQKPQLAETYGRLPLSFEMNAGQTDPRVKFLSRGGGHTLFLTFTEAVLALKQEQKEDVGLPAANSTYLGGSGGDNGTSIATDSSGNAWVTANTNPRSTISLKTKELHRSLRGHTRREPFCADFSTTRLTGVPGQVRDIPRGAR